MNGSQPSDCKSRSQKQDRYFENIDDISPIFFNILPIYLQYFTDISLIFTNISLIFIDILPEIPAHVGMRYTFDISAKYQHFSIFYRNIGSFSNFLPIFLPINFRLIKSYLFRSISDITVIYRPIKPIFSSLGTKGSIPMIE